MQLSWYGMCRASLFVTILTCALVCASADDSHYNPHDSESSILTKAQKQGIHLSVDANADGLASIEEFTSFAFKMRKFSASRDMESALLELDADGDGRLDAQEAMAIVGSAKEGGEDENAKLRRAHELEKFNVADADGDGRLDVNEALSYFFPEMDDATAWLAAKFALKARDDDGDGELSAVEFWAYVRNSKLPAALSDEELRIFRLLDKDRSGKLSLGELIAYESGAHHVSAHLEEMFEALDTNADSHISVSELHSVANWKDTGFQHYFLEWVEHLDL
eukprot:TRINITY_DN22295_c0_g2_i1.p1 TRINITY_DN22295_c0_g2~~TRINITY_DN22295_c0_g2_i1.p1  ORF type:complete len:279 (-),score=59.85 TRINITY_DN22295_c0_g2_i1:168-1004(-)